MNALATPGIPKAPLNRPGRLQPPAPAIHCPLHVNVLIASMAVGGAERCVQETLLGLRSRAPTGKLFVMHRVTPRYPLEALHGFEVFELEGRDAREKLHRVALEVLASPSSTLYTHLVRSHDLAQLWGYGLTTIPVVHNSAPGWLDPPAAFDSDRVPFIVAVSDDVRRQLRDAGCPKPISVVRHELQTAPSAEAFQRDREEIRARHGIRDGTFVIGLVGQFKAHKSYIRAVRVLAELRRSAKAKLMIVGGWDHDYGAGRVAYTATLKLALELGVLPDIICTGPVLDAQRYYPAFDLFLNTSVYEGLSIATLEAAQSGCPIVCADVGGQREAVPPDAALIGDPSDIDEYVRAVKARMARRRVFTPAPVKAPDLVPRLWALLAEHGTVAASDVPSTLFVTSNLNPGGAQRSLTNLLCAMHERHRSWLCVMGHVLGEHFMGELQAHGVTTIGMPADASTLERVERVLQLVRRLGASTVCFWNMDPNVKLLIAKVLEHSRVRLIDVSPGPLLFEELDAARELQRRIAFDSEDYLARLDVLVAKYCDGTTPPRYRARPRNTVVIPNGVAIPAASRQVQQAVHGDFDPELSVVTCCRIAPNKRLEWLLEMAARLRELVPGASLTVFGGVDQRHLGYWETICAQARSQRLGNVRFAGENADVFSFLPAFKVFVMVARAQGCPNASLEAMAAGLPVVANSDGGTGEQVIEGRTGYLVADDSTETMARRVASLLRDPARAQRMGAAGRARAQRHFSLETMARGYLDILQPPFSNATSEARHEQEADA